MTERREAGMGNASVGTFVEGGGVRCLAVGRGTQHAARHVTNDGLMFDLVCTGLRAFGWIVELIAEDELAATIHGTGFEHDCIISMAQRPENVELLRGPEVGGIPIVNDPAAVTNCYRSNLVETLKDSEVPFARSIVLGPVGMSYDYLAVELGPEFWLKRGDIHAAHENDVRLVGDAGSFAEAIENFRSREVDTLVAQEHLPGEVVKFYAVAGTGFFHAQYFESEADVTFDTAPLESVADAAAARLGLTIYGGDVVLTAHRGPVVIDLNAWPSFGKVRAAAAPKMVEAIRRIVDSR